MFWLNFCTTNQIFAVLRVFIGISRMCARLGWVAPALVLSCIGLLFSIDSNIHDAFALSNCTYFSVRLCKTLCNCWLSFCCTNSFRTTIHRPSSSFSLPSHSKHYKHHSNIHTPSELDTCTQFPAFRWDNCIIIHFSCSPYTKNGERCSEVNELNGNSHFCKRSSCRAQHLTDSYRLCCCTILQKKSNPYLPPAFS